MYIKIFKRFLVFLVIVIMTAVTGCSVFQNGDYQTDDSAYNGGIDYSIDDNWAYFNDNENRIADCFLICPTVTNSVDGKLNAEITDDYKADFVSALDAEKGIYADSCTMYAPFYRQAVMDVYELPDEDREQYFEIAYNDIKASFDYYMKKCNKGRPIVLAGFSQGSDMVLRLLKDEFDNKKYQDRLVAAYMIGWPVTPQDIEQYPHIKMAQNSQDTGVVVSFNSEAESVNTSMFVPQGTTSLSINPLTWTTDSTPADATYNMGACFMYGDKAGEEVYQFCGAYIDDERGTLKVTGIDGSEFTSGSKLFGEGVYHLYDYQFFYRNLQYNVAERLDKFGE